MTNLTRRPSNDDRDESWHVYYGDVCIGWIGKRAGVPSDGDQWGWRCGFSPGCEPGQQSAGSADSFELARADFEGAWSDLLPKLSGADFEAWRRQRDTTAWKYRMWDYGLKLPAQLTSGESRYFCGEVITTATAFDHAATAHRNGA
jgi:hypothetical protein